jgi:LuxR family maltose regulon positive regulatory protein
VPLTLVCAQAGAGKTTLAAVVAERVGRVGWLALDEGDDDPATLVELLAMVVGEVVPGGCPAAAELVASAPTAGALDARRAVGVLVNDVLAADPPPFVVVLDDLHLVRDAGSLAALDHLVAHAPPPLHLLATARSDPGLGLARLRARGRLAEVRADDLRFGPDRSDALLNGRLGLGLSRAEIAAIVDAAGGWVTGVRLLARSSRRGSVPVGRGDEAVYDYLADEVVAGEADDVARFLVETSVLADLTPAACETVTGRADAAGVLADLHRRHGLFVQEIDGAARTYRYHDLFAAFLRDRLQREGGREAAAALHRRAAAPSSGLGAAARIEHLLAAEAWDGAAAAIEALVAGSFLRPGEMARVVGWVRRLPDAVASAHPWLQLAVGTAAVQRGDFAAAPAPLGTALERFSAAGPGSDAAEVFRGRWLAVRSLHVASNDHARYVPMLAELEASPSFASLPPAARVDHHMSSAYGALFADRWDETARRVGLALDLAGATADLASIEVLAQHLSPLLLGAPGVLDRMEAFVGWVDARFRTGPPLVRLGVHHQQALVAFVRGRYPEAVAAVRAAGDLPERLGGFPYLRATLDWVETAVAFAGGDLAAVARRLGGGGRWREPASTELERDLRLLHLALLARALHLSGRAGRADEGPVGELAALVEAVGWVGSGPGPASGGGERYADQAVLTAAVVRAQAGRAAGRPEEAVEVLRAAVPVADRARLVPFVGLLRLDLAVALEAAGGPGAAAAAQEELRVVLSGPTGTPGLLAAAGPEMVPLLARARADVRLSGADRVTVEAALSLLGSPSRPSPVAVAGGPEVLSSREVEILRLLAAGASNQAIAADLVISVNTVKTHVARVIGKLGARSRTEAVARARDLRLL